MTKPILALIGYGKMGREIELAAYDLGFQIRSIIDVAKTEYSRPITSSTLQGVDVCIEFTAPDAVLSNIAACAEAGRHIVVGTTGWDIHRETVREIVHKRGIGLVYASNFSIGVNLFKRIVSAAAAIMDKYPYYDVSIHETHHRMKRDAPSGTALDLGYSILSRLHRKTSMVHFDQSLLHDESALIISSMRVGSVPGIHSVVIDGSADTIELTHTARSRRGFAEGALMAAEWIATRKGVFSIEEMLDDIESI